MQNYRGFLFCLVLSLLWIPCLAILIQIYDFAGMGDWAPGQFFALAIARSAPFIAKDASLFGELTPVAVAAGLTVLAPQKTEANVFYVAVAICLIGWIQYLALSVLMQGGWFTDAVLTLLDGDTPKDDFIALKGFATSTRVFYLVVGATLFGLRLRKDAAG